jgi:hypothetical protein
MFFYWVEWSRFLNPALLAEIHSFAHRRVLRFPSTLDTMASLDIAYYDLMGRCP